jgi:hypothetical protein
MPAPISTSADPSIWAPVVTANGIIAPDRMLNVRSKRLPWRIERPRVVGSRAGTVTFPVRR